MRKTLITFISITGPTPISTLGALSVSFLWIPSIITLTTLISFLESITSTHYAFIVVITCYATFNITPKTFIHVIWVWVKSVVLRTSGYTFSMLKHIAFKTWLTGYTITSRTRSTKYTLEISAGVTNSLTFRMSENYI